VLPRPVLPHPALSALLGANPKQNLRGACRQANVVVSIGVNERDGGTLYNTQLLFDADGTLIQRRRKISPTYHERMVWGMGGRLWAARC
jgi:predicted amidohydrolase